MTKPNELISRNHKSSYLRTPNKNAKEWAERYLNKRKLSVIIPIYNATPEIVALVRDKKTMSCFDEIIIIDDLGPRNDFYLIEKQTIHSKTKIIHNTRNVGFVRSVNSGIESANIDNDLLILNSDAVINDQSIKSLTLTAYSEPMVGTVSPLSNSNGYFSIDLINEATKANTDKLRDAHQMLSQLDAPLYESTPVNNGFCLYITRQTIENIGLLDDDLFYRGYGEETDFCCRCVENGFKNLISFSSYGLHSAASSFGLEKNNLKKINGQLLKSLHPKFVTEMTNYEKSSALNSLKSIKPPQTESSEINNIYIKTSSPSHTIQSNHDLIVNPHLVDFADIEEYLLFLAIKYAANHINFSSTDWASKNTNKLISAILT